MTVRIELCVALALCAAGCGMSQASLDEARSHVVSGLDLWKQGGKPDAMKSLPQPVEFHEAMWNAGDTLLNYEIGRVSYDDGDKVFRCEVRLTVRTRRGKTRTENVYYDVLPGSPVKIINNPMP